MIAFPELLPIRVAPAVNSSIADWALRMPPEALIPISADTADLSNPISATVAPLPPNPVDVWM